LHYPKVLAITKRTADLCVTQATLYAAGFELVTATNLMAARVLLRSLPIHGVIVCMHSWSESERDSIFGELKALELPIMKCPGCTGCDELRHKVGTLDNMLPLTTLISKLSRTELHD